MSIIVVPSQLAAMPPVPPCHIADGVIPKASIVGLVAQAGAGKTFTALDMALALANRSSWFGRRTEADGVLYVCGEGFAGMPGRVLAWCAEHGVSPESLDQRIGFCRVPVDISDEAMRLRVTATLQELRITADVVFLDTLSANAPPGFNENGTDHMKVMMDSARHLRDSLPCSVVLVHHMGHDAMRERGSTDFRGTMDVLLYLKVDGEHRVLSVNKSRDFEPFTPMRFTLAPRHGSAVLTSAGDAAGFVLTPSQRAVLLRLAELSDGGPVRAKDWKSACGYSKAQFHKIVAELSAVGYVAASSVGYMVAPAGRGTLSRSHDPDETSFASSSPTSHRSHSSLMPADRGESHGLISVSSSQSPGATKVSFSPPVLHTGGMRPWVSEDREMVSRDHDEILMRPRSMNGNGTSHSGRSATGLLPDYGPGLEEAPWPEFDVGADAEPLPTVHRELPPLLRGIASFTESGDIFIPFPLPDLEDDCDAAVSAELDDLAAGVRPRAPKLGRIRLAIISANHAPPRWPS